MKLKTCGIKFSAINAITMRSGKNVKFNTVSVKLLKFINTGQVNSSEELYLYTADGTFMSKALD